MAINTQTNVSKLMDLINSYKDLQMSFVATYEEVGQTHDIRVVATYRKNILSAVKGSNPPTYTENDIVIFQSSDPDVLKTITQTYFIFPSAYSNIEYNFIFEMLLGNFQRVIQNTSFD